MPSLLPNKGPYNCCFSSLPCFCLYNYLIASTLAFCYRFVVVPHHQVTDRRSGQRARTVAMEDGLAVASDRLVEVLVSERRRKVLHVTVLLQGQVSSYCLGCSVTKYVYLWSWITKQGVPGSTRDCYYDRQLIHCTQHPFNSSFKYD